MPRNDLVFVCSFSNVLGPIEEACTRSKLGHRYRLAPIEGFGFSFPETMEGVLVAELTFAADDRGKDPEGVGQFFPPESLPRLEKSSAVVVLVRIPQDDKSISALIDAGFRVAGSIKSSAPLTERAIRASFPVDRFVKGAISPAIIIGRANVNLLAQARAFGECGVPVYCILTRDESPFIVRSSRHVKKVIDCRGHSDHYIATCISDIAAGTVSKPVLYTGGDLEIGLLSRIWGKIEGLVLAPNNPKLAKLLNNKKLQIEKVKAAGIKVPLSRLVENISELKYVIQEFNFPVICKPTELEKKGAFIGKTFVAENSDQLEKHFGRCFLSPNSPVLIQEYIPGGECNILFAMAACSNEGEANHVVTGRKLLDDGRGCIGLGETTSNLLLKRESKVAFKALGVGGLNGVEFKFNDVTGELFYIEANFRAENFYSLSKAAGVNLSILTYLEAVGCPNIYYPLGPRKAKWMDASLIFIGWIRSLSGRLEKSQIPNKLYDRCVVVDALWAKNDPGPAIAWYILKSTSLVAKTLRKIFRLKR